MQQYPEKENLIFGVIPSSFPLILIIPILQHYQPWIAKSIKKSQEKPKT